MQTPKLFKANLKNGIVTDDMLAAAIYSVNKRAKNARDKEREYRNYYRWHRYAFDKYGNEEKARDKKEEYYGIKDELLSFADDKIKCIHKVERLYTTEYFLLYDFGNYSFHHPIDELDEKVIKQMYKKEIIELDDLETEGEDISSLMSMTFVREVLKTLKNSQTNKSKIYE